MAVNPTLAVLVVNYMVLLLAPDKADTESVMIYAFPAILGSLWVYTMGRCIVELLKIGFRVENRYKKFVCSVFTVCLVVSLGALATELVILVLAVRRKKLVFHPTFRAVGEVVVSFSVIGTADILPGLRRAWLEIRELPSTPLTEPVTSMIRRFPCRFQRWLVKKFPELRRDDAAAGNGHTLRRRFVAATLGMILAGIVQRRMILAGIVQRG